MTQPLARFHQTLRPNEPSPLTVRWQDTAGQPFTIPTPAEVTITRANGADPDWSLTVPATVDGAVLTAELPPLDAGHYEADVHAADVHLAHADLDVTGVVPPLGQPARSLAFGIRATP